ncbi:MAG: T9SS type A sorting domain-containing protein, partial [Saprospiraceae bacterium]|nr:T9SS type A sorting domain-containing protein [Saprospiraceae bacterium]
AEASQMISICGFDPAMASSAVGNNVWVDEDQDGLQDSTEVGLNFAKIYLYAVDTSSGYQATMIDSTQSNSIEGVAGQFQFHHLTPGMYQLAFQSPDSTMTFTYFKQGLNDSIDSDVNQITGMTDIIHLDQGDVLPNIDAGFILLSAVLPVELTSFTGRSYDCVNTLDWSTASEIGTDQFELQRSIDGVTFETVVSIPALGGPTIATNYTYDDKKAAGENLYRLKILDLDGTIDYSEIITLNMRCNRQIEQGEIFVYPNPVHSEAKIEFTLDREMPVQIRILDKLGRTIHQQKMSLGQGRHIEALDMANLPNGMYSISVQFDGTIKNKTIIKNH